MVIKHNLSAINAQRQFKLNSAEMDSSLEKLASGEKINRAKDDPAGLAVSEKMRAQIRGLNQASRNAQDGISFVQTAEGWLVQTTDLLQRMRELAVQAANGIYTTEDRVMIQTEVSQLIDEIDRIASQAEFNQLRLLKAKAGGSSDAEQTPDGGVVLRVHLGANMDQYEQLTIRDMSANALGLTDGSGPDRKITLVYASQADANQALTRLDNALRSVTKQRTDMGTFQNRLEFAMRGIDLTSQNLQAAESRIRDTDMASEMVEFVKNQMLVSSSSSMLAQANVRPQSIMRLLS